MTDWKAIGRSKLAALLLVGALGGGAYTVSAGVEVQADEEMREEAAQMRVLAEKLREDAVWLRGYAAAQSNSELSMVSGRLSMMAQAMSAAADRYALRAEATSGEREAVDALDGALAKRHDSESIGFLRTITTAQALFREGDKDKNGVLDYAGSLEQLAEAGLLGEDQAEKRGLVASILQADQRSWSAIVGPKAPRRGSKRFFADESGAIRFSTTEAPTSRSTPVGH